MEQNCTFRETCGGQRQRHEETWSDRTSVTLDQIEKELMALKVNMGGKGGNGGYVFQEYCNFY